ncbi:MAG TPA: VWA domain-containing protein, partial [Candidatus Bathyarchaeia archaeon]|nr:VWA domain-containing protein [Candidatus Bathyarchaeia archaeon]
MFKTPLILVLIPIVLAAVIWFHRRQRPAAIRFSHTAILPQGIVSWRQRLLKLPFVLRLIALTLFIVALAGPRSVLDYSEYKTEGIDIVLAIDVSTSMAAEDFLLNGKRENRLEVVKSVVKDFVTARRSDRIALVAFASQAYTVSPLTTDQYWLLSNLERLRFGLIQDGTAVGSGLSSALLRLKDSKAKSKVVVLLTDGVNNTG